MVRRYMTLLVFGAVGAALTFGHTVNAWQADAIIALERGALDRWGQADPGGYLALYAPDVTYFDPMRDRRVDGLASLTQLLEPIRGTFKSDGYEMIAPKVHRAGPVNQLKQRQIVQSAHLREGPVVAEGLRGGGLNGG